MIVKQRAARFQVKSVNRKLSPVAMQPYNGPARAKFPFRPVAAGPFCCSTYASIESTCDDVCPFKRRDDGKSGGCFADSGRTTFLVRELDRNAALLGNTSFDSTLDEVAEIDGAFVRGVPQDGAKGGRDLRLHVSGDVASAGAAAMLGEAATRWRSRGGGTVWTYTHTWRTIDRAMWGDDVSVLASIEHPTQAKEARARGYASAIVVDEFPNGAKAFSIDERTKAVPCPAESGKTTCVECRLCLDVDLLGINRAIAFRAHGWDRHKVLTQITRRQLPLLGATP